MPAFNVYVGYDAREQIAYDVCEYSLRCRTKTNVNVLPLKHRDLRERGLFRRPWNIQSDTGLMIDAIDNRPFSTEFSHTRFLIPQLQDFKGWSLFLDCDMIFQCDVRELINLCNDKYAVMLVKHNHKPPERTKMDKQVQQQYYRKNWSSFVLWNCSHPSNKGITAPAVNMMTGTELHGFSWLKEYEIGHLGYEWNWIEKISPANIEPKVIHYTNGGPWFKECQEVTFADKWLTEYKRMIKLNEGVVSEIL